MITVPEVVDRIVRRSPYLEEAMSRGLVNISALARAVRPEVAKELMKPVKDGAVMMALNRLSRRIQKRHRGARKFFRTAPDLMVRSGLVEITFANSNSLPRRLQDLLASLRGTPNYFLTLTQGIHETTIIVSKNLEERLLRAFRGERILSEFSNLTSLTVQLPQGTFQVAGVYNYILKALAWEGINITEVVSTLNEFSLILEDRNIGPAFSIIKRLF